MAGPVVAAAVVLPKDYTSTVLTDSKKLSHKRRIELRKEIEEIAVSCAIGIVSPKEIDQINILNASFLAMHKAIDQIKNKIDLLIIDGNRFNPYPNIDHECIIKGDSKYLSIAAASILAKTERDAIMIDLDSKHPDYNWQKNKGYPTKEHRDAIRTSGLTKHHRKTFSVK